MTATAMPTPAQLFSKLSSRKKTRKRALAKRWQDAVIAICDNKSPTPEIIETLLDDCGKTDEDLQSAVKRLENRRVWFAAVERAKTVDKERGATIATIQAAEATAAAEITAAQRKLNEALAPLKSRLAELDSLERAGLQANQRLADTYDDTFDDQLDAEIVAENEKLNDARKRLGEQRFLAAKYARAAGEAAAELSPHRSLPLDLEWRQVFQRRQDEATAKEQEHLASIPAIDAEIKSIEAQITELESRKTVP